MDFNFLITALVEGAIKSGAQNYAEVLRMVEKNLAQPDIQLLSAFDSGQRRYACHMANLKSGGLING